MILIGLTGPIGHGKSSFAKAVELYESSYKHFESSMIIAEVANELHKIMHSLPKRDDVDSINDWLKALPEILKKTVHTNCTYDQIKLDADRINKHPIEYVKLFLHIQNLASNPELAKRKITKDNKEAYRPFLQWLGGYLVRHVDDSIWYKEICRRVKITEQEGFKLCIVGGLRFPQDATTLRSAGGIIIKVYRPDHLQYDMLDPTERERDNIKPDCIIISNGSLDDLNMTTKKVLEDLSSYHLQKNYYTKKQ